MAISDYTISELGELYRKKELSPVEVTEKMLKLAKDSQPQINSIVLFTEERAMKEAKLAEKKFMGNEKCSPLCGIPYNVKDLIDVKGTATTMGCKAYHDNYKEHDSAVVEMLSAAGAVLMGKSNTSQLAMGTTGDVSLFGATRNPRNLEKVPGGSSCGSGASVAAGISAFSIGTDQGGSVRIPAAFCGVVGIKPTFGRISYYCSASAHKMVDHLGVSTRNVYDNALVLSAASGYDPRYEYSFNAPSQNFAKEITRSAEGMIICVPTKFCYDDVEYWLTEQYTKALEILKEGGAKVKEVEMPDLSTYRKAHQQIFMVGAIYNHAYILAERGDQIESEMYDRMKAGDIPASEFFKDIEMQKDLMKIFLDLMDGCDFMFTPTMGAFPCGQMEREITLNGQKVPIYEPNTRYTWWGNYLGMPGLTIPVAFNKDNNAANVQFVGRQGEEAKLYRAASYVEHVVGSADITKLPGLDY
ncbi:amidase [Desulfosporosinus sp. BICA1-9]|uniref:amidase n=1 Tax=Desulfosporosinus sp. BICA1-9 TaxID=1531958 RepID=UPI00054C696E|nr:amidase [Desulfosporosinus sp. BICA1-9]KJS50841.1 MAG: hypothetical protein VR66_00590 [Peptococcaceae bacterium BRH_c23]KJS80764.1 MAG: hypothetical protein JL57_27600 [Desulfosporosinus sp. BICA1-9]HBW35880.1 amidase [Desulfosporosinus sp.]